MKIKIMAKVSEKGYFQKCLALGEIGVKTSREVNVNFLLMIQISVCENVNKKL